MATKKADKDIMVDVFNNDTGSVSYKSEINRVKRLWEKPNSVKSISLEELKEQMSTTGGEVLFREGILLIKDNNIREELGLPTSKEYTMDTESINELLDGSVEDLTEILDSAPQTIKEKIAIQSIEKEIGDYSKQEVIEEKTGIKVNESIKERREDKKKSASKK